MTVLSSINDCALIACNVHDEELMLKIVSGVEQEWNRKLSSSEQQKTDLSERVQQMFSTDGTTLTHYSLCGISLVVSA